MSDGDLRKILNDIIDDLDTGRARVPRPRRLVRWIGAPVLAASVGLGLGGMGCNERAIGHTDDAGVTQQVDSGSSEDYAAPPVDAGNVYAYGIPPMEDAGTEAADAEADADLDPPNAGLYAAPDIEVEPYDAGTPPDPDPDPEAPEDSEDPEE